MAQDRHAYERALLRHMLTVRTPEGDPVVWEESYFRDIIDDLNELNYPAEMHASAMRAWAFNLDSECCPYMPLFDAMVAQSYRVMAGAFSWGYQPDWLCVAPSARWLHPDHPAWDRFGKKFELELHGVHSTS